MGLWKGRSCLRTKAPRAIFGKRLNAEDDRDRSSRGGAGGTKEMPNLKGLGFVVGGLEVAGEGWLKGLKGYFKLNHGIDSSPSAAGKVSEYCTAKRPRIPLGVYCIGKGIYVIF